MDVELSEIQDSFFTKWVAINDWEPQPTRMQIVGYKDDVLGSAVKRWLQHPNRAETDKVKRKIRQGVRPRYRATLWRVISGGAEKLHDNPNYYQDTVADIGIQIPTTLPASMFTGTDTPPNYYYLAPAGGNVILKIMYVLTQTHPDIQFCPLLPSLVAIFLHFMEEGECFACLSSMLDSHTVILDQSQREVAIMAKTFQDCFKMYMNSAYRSLKSYIEVSTGSTVTKGIVMLPYWLHWMFQYLDFWTLVSIVDSFLLQGPKLLVRFALVIFSQFSKWLNSRQALKGSLEELFSQFMKESPPKGQKLQETAFKIRGLSRKKLARLKNKNLELLDSGELEVPYKREAPLRETAVMALQGTNMVSEQEWEKLSSWLPDRVRIKKPLCLLNTNEDGCSINTFYNKCQEEEETLLLIKTRAGDAFGAFCTSPWLDRLQGPKKLTFFGTGESFVFSLAPHMKRYPWSGLQEDNSQSKDFFMAGDEECIIIGGGGDNAIWLDAQLECGHSGRSQTFNNEPLTTQQDFICTRMEVFGFVS